MIFIASMVGAFLVALLALGSRQLIKESLPREGEVEKVGGVYTPYLLLDSTLYFMKNWDESLELASSKSFAEKAIIQLSFTNKRLLEMERLAREKNYIYHSVMLDNFVQSLQQAINFTHVAVQSGDEVETLVWIIQESGQDQQRIFTKIIDQLPLEKQVEVVKVKKQSADEIEKLLKSIYKLN